MLVCFKFLRGSQPELPEEIFSQRLQTYQKVSANEFPAAKIQS